MDRREAVVWLGGLAAFSFLSAQNTDPSSSSALPTHGTDYVALAEHCAIEYGLDPACFVRQINQESGFNPRAFSSAGAIGIAQFMPETAASLGINPADPVASLYGAAHLMSQYVAFYHGSYALALAAYNAGSGAVNEAIQQGGENWYAYLPLETQHYITVIMG